MPSRSRSEYRALKRRARKLMSLGSSVREAAEELGVAPSTIRRWRKRARGARPRPARAPRRRGSASTMLRAEASDVYRVLLDAAKGGDMRAVGLVLKLLANSIPEETDDGDNNRACDELERGLQSLPAAIASEIVGLLAKAHPGAAGKAGGGDEAASGPGGRCGLLPWEAADPASDEGPDPV